MSVHLPLMLPVSQLVLCSEQRSLTSSSRAEVHNGGPWVVLCIVEPGAFVSPSGPCPLQLCTGRAVGKKGSFEWGLVGESPQRAQRGRGISFTGAKQGYGGP